MGKLFTDQTDTFRVELEDDVWVEMREKITYGDREIATNAAVGRLGMKGQRKRKGKEKQKEVEVEMLFSQPAYTIALLKRMITAWSEDEPVTEDNIRQLPDTTVDQLMEELNERNEVRDEEESGPLETDSSSLSETPSAPVAGQAS